MKNLGLGFLALILSVFVGLLGTKVVLSVATLFGLTFLAGLGFLKLYGLLSIVNLLLYKDKDSEDDEDGDKIVSKLLIRVFTKAFLYLTFWGLSFLMYNILA